MTAIELLERKRIDKTLSTLDFYIIIDQLYKNSFPLNKELLYKYLNDINFTTTDVYLLVSIFNANGIYININRSINSVLDDLAIKTISYINDTAGLYGTVSKLLAQIGNASTDIKIKLAYVGSTVGNNWNAGVSYGASELKAYPSGSPIIWRVKMGEAVGPAENPPISNSKWELAIGVDVIQALGGGKYARTTLQRDGGEFIKMGPTEIGVPSTSKFLYNATLSNFVGAGANANIGTAAASSISIPTSHPSARSITIGTGITGIANSSTIGTCTDSFVIPTTHVTMMTRNLPTGLSLSPGDTLVLYGDANNFIITAVARYYSATGIAYLASIQHCGSGTFSSWSLKKEQYRRIFRTSNSAQHFHCLIQSYDSGTGLLAVNSVKNTGSATVSDWTLSIAKEVTDPTSSQMTQINGLDAEAVGYWFVVNGTGTGFEHMCTVDNRGTGFRYIYADGPLIANPPPDVIIDTYNATLISSSAKVIFDDISVGTHKFFAVSITSPSGLSSNTRTWAKASTNSSNVQTLNQYYNIDTFTRDFEVCGHGQSVGELAFRFRENADAGDGFSWLPFHGSFTETAIHTFIINNVTINVQNNFTTGLNPYALKYVPFVEFNLNQVGNMIHPQAVGNLGSYISTHIINKNGADFSGTFTWTVDTFRTVGYVNMLFLAKQFAKRIKFNKTSIIYNTPQGAEPDTIINTADLNPGSVLCYNDGSGILGENNYAFANYNAGTSLPWASAFINNYDSTYNKLYPVSNSNEIIPAGRVEVIKSKWYLGNRGNL